MDNMKKNKKNKTIRALQSKLQRIEIEYMNITDRVIFVNGVFKYKYPKQVLKLRLELEKIKYKIKNKTIIKKINS